MSEVQDRGEARTGRSQDAEPDQSAVSEPGSVGTRTTDTDALDGDAGAAEAADGAVDADSGDPGSADPEPDHGGPRGEEKTRAKAARATADAQKIKIAIPAAREIPRGDFTPHALNAKGRGAPRSGTRAAARRRRIVVTAGLCALALATAGAGVWYQMLPEPSVKVSGAFGKAPAITVPKDTPAKAQTVKHVIRGSGPAVANGDWLVAHLVSYKWSASGGTELLNTYKKGKPVIRQPGEQFGLPALDKAVIGLRTGSRVVLTLPYRALGELAQGLQLKPTEDFVVTVDLIGTYGKNSSAQGTPVKLDDAALPAVTAGAPGAAPTVKIPSGDAPGKLTVKTLIQGSGSAVAKGQTLIVQYHGVLWRNGKVFDSTWQRGTPYSFPLGAGQVIAGWDNGLVEQKVKVGSRVLLVVPPKDGYGTKGSPDGTIKGSDTLVFVIDVLAAS